MTARRLPYDLEQMLRAGHLVESEPGVFRRPVPRRMPSRDAVYSQNVHGVVKVAPLAAQGAAAGSQGGREPVSFPGSETPPATSACGAGPAGEGGAGAALAKLP